MTDPFFSALAPPSKGTGSKEADPAAIRRNGCNKVKEAGSAATKCNSRNKLEADPAQREEQSPRIGWIVPRPSRSRPWQAIRRNTLTYLPLQYTHPNTEYTDLLTSTYLQSPLPNIADSAVELHAMGERM